MNPLRGILLKLGQVLLASVVWAIIKAVAPSIPAGEAVFFRSFFAMPVIVVWLALRGDLSTGLRVVSPMLHVWRGLIGTAGMGLYFAGLGLLPLPEVTAIGFATPILVVIFAAMFLGEQVRFFRLLAVAIGLAGVVIVVAPRLGAFSGGTVETTQALGALLVLAGATVAALIQVFVRRMVATEQTSAIVFYFSITATVMSLLSLPFGWVVPSAWELFLLASAGVLGGISQIFLTSAYRYADASLVAPFDYTSMIFAVVIGYFVFSEIPTDQTLIGAALVILAGGLIIWRERQLGLQRSQARKGMNPN